MDDGESNVDDNDDDGDKNNNNDNYDVDDDDDDDDGDDDDVRTPPASSCLPAGRTTAGEFQSELSRSRPPAASFENI